MDSIWGEYKNYGSDKEQITCEHCGHISVRYKQRFTKNLYRSLIAWRDLGTGVVSDFKEQPRLYRLVRNNSTRLSYWGVIAKNFVDVNGRPTQRGWHITDLGRDFLGGRVSIPEFIWTIEDRVIAHYHYISKDEITMSFQDGEDFREQARED